MCKCRLAEFERKPEQFFTHTKWIAEFWNTLSNLPFILIGFIRLECDTQLKFNYQLMIFTGICSVIHHATTQKWTLIIDWIPILISLVVNLNYLSYAEMPEMLILLVAFVWLLIDHIATPVPVPWGHVIWHILAAYSIDIFYQKIEHNIILNQIVDLPILAHLDNN